MDAARNVGFPEVILKKALELKACDPYLSLKDQLQEEKRRLEEERGRVQALLKDFENRLEEVLAQAERKKTVGSRASGTLKETVRREALQTFKAISPEGKVPEAFMPSTLLIGDRVRIEGMKGEGVVAALNQERHRADVLLGELKVRLPIESLHPLPKADPKPQVMVHLQEAPGDSEDILDVRGMDAESALGLIERQISRALTKGKGSVKILHGVGALRRLLREAIQENYQGIALVRPGHDLEGGEAFSIVELR
jgi:DNA mismatch repair protein MutS2